MRDKEEKMLMAMLKRRWFLVRERLRSEQANELHGVECEAYESDPGPDFFIMGTDLLAVFLQEGTFPLEELGPGFSKHVREHRAAIEVAPDEQTEEAVVKAVRYQPLFLLDQRVRYVFARAVASRDQRILGKFADAIREYAAPVRARAPDHRTAWLLSLVRYLAYEKIIDPSSLTGKTAIANARKRILEHLEAEGLEVLSKEVARMEKLGEQLRAWRNQGSLPDHKMLEILVHDWAMRSQSHRR